MRCSGLRKGAGASSTSFWLRRWSEQSRVPTTITLPWVSASTWASTCRGLSRNFSTKHSPRPKAETASRTAESKSSGISSLLRTTLSPRPPPPNAALIAIGIPCSSANATTSSASLTGSLVPGTNGAPTLVAMCRACTLSPRAMIASGEGPIQVSPASMTAWAKSAFSERKPYPGWTASAPDCFAASMIFSITR